MTDTTNEPQAQAGASSPQQPQADNAAAPVANQATENAAQTSSAQSTSQGDTAAPSAPSPESKGLPTDVASASTTETTSGPPSRSEHEALKAKVTSLQESHSWLMNEFSKFKQEVSGFFHAFLDKIHNGEAFLGHEYQALKDRVVGWFK